MAAGKIKRTQRTHVNFELKANSGSSCLGIEHRVILFDSTGRFDSVIEI